MNAQSQLIYSPGGHLAKIAPLNGYKGGTNTSIVVMENVRDENFDIAYFYEQKIRDILKQGTLLR